jgi:hypothetical protein
MNKNECLLEKRESQGGRDTNNRWSRILSRNKVAIRMEKLKIAWKEGKE